MRIRRHEGAPVTATSKEPLEGTAKVRQILNWVGAGRSVRLRVLACGCENGTVWVWRLRYQSKTKWALFRWLGKITGRAQPIILCGHQGAVRRVWFLSPGKNFASEADDNTVRVWNIQDRVRTFAEGKRRGHCPYKHLGLKLPTYDWWELLQMNPEELELKVSTIGVAECVN